MEMNEIKERYQMKREQNEQKKIIYKTKFQRYSQKNNTKHRLKALPNGYVCDHMR